jgi:hypothetical protein
MKAKKFIMWIVIFSVLTVYSLQLLRHYNDNSSHNVYAASPRDIVEEQKRTLFARVIDQLTLRKEHEEDQCNTGRDVSSEAHCTTASIFARLILMLSSHVS